MRPNDGRVVSNFVTQALKGEPLTVYGDGTQTRSFCFVDDMVEAIASLLFSDETEPVNLGNPHEMSVLELARLVQELLDSKSGIIMQPLPVDDPKVRQPDTSRAREVLGWEPRVTLREGLAQTIDFFRGST
jgi:dTDP-glucose 4,6-dehydratase